MRKIFVAVVAVGICFGVTGVEAGDSPYDCYTLKNFIKGSLSSNDQFKTLYLKRVEKNLPNESEERQAYAEHAEHALTTASQCATIYIALCKK